MKDQDFEIREGVLRRYLGEGTKAVVPDGVRVIGCEAFDFGGSVREVILPDSVKFIDDRAFKGCYTLESVRLPEGLLCIGEKAFAECRRLKEIIIPDSVDVIQYRAFSECGNLKVMIGHKEGRFIGNKAFSGCRTDPDENGFMIIGNVLVRYAGRGKTAVIPEGVERIEEGSFCSLDDLTGVIIPGSVTGMDPEAFRDCRNLICIRIPRSVSLTSTDKICVPYVICYSPGTASQSPYPVYLGGSPFDLTKKARFNAAIGFFYAIAHDIHEIDLWKEEYVRLMERYQYDRAFRDYILSDREALSFMMREGVLSRKAAELCLEQMKEEKNTEDRADLLQYINDRFGTSSGSVDDLRL